MAELTEEQKKVAADAEAKKALEEKERLEKEQKEKEKPEIDPTIQSIIDGGADAIAKLLEAKRTANAEAKDQRLALEKINTEKDEAEKKKLEEEGKFKELAEKSEAKAEALEKKTKELFITQALQIEAMKQGIVDIDGVGLADRSKCSIAENYNSPDDVTGADEAIKDLMTRKAYLFDEDKKKDFFPRPGGGDLKPGLREKVNATGDDTRSPHAKAASFFDKSAKEKAKK